MSMMALGFGTFIALVAVLGLPLLLRDPWFSVPFLVVPGAGTAVVFAVAGVLVLVGVLGE